MNNRGFGLCPEVLSITLHFWAKVQNSRYFYEMARKIRYRRYRRSGPRSAALLSLSLKDSTPVTLSI